MSSNYELQQCLTGEVNEWTRTLPAYQRSIIDQMLETGDPASVAIRWLEAAGAQDTAPYGAVRSTARAFYVNLLKEVQEFLCGGLRYDRERAEFLQSTESGKLAIVGTVSAAIAPQIGVSPVIIGPTVALVFAILANATKATACQMLEGLIAEHENSNKRTK